MPGRSLARDASTVAMITALARVVGFARWLVFAAAVGAAGVGTVYQSVNAIPNIVYEIAAGGILAAVVVPLLARLAAEADRSPEGRGDVDAVASAILTRTLAALVPVTVVVLLAAPWISARLLGDLPIEGAVTLGTHLLLLFTPQILLYGIGVVVTGVLHAHRRFVAAALAPLLSSLVVIATYVAYGLVVGANRSVTEVPATAVWILGLGTTGGVIALSLPLLVAARQAGIRLRPAWALPTDLVRRATSLAGAGLIALVAQQLAVLVMLKVANRSGGDGAVVVNQYAQTVYLLPYAVLAVPIATAAFPTLAAGDRTAPSAGETERRTLGSALAATTALTGIAAGSLIAAAGAIAAVFAALDRGREDGAGDALAAMGPALTAWAPGLIGFGVAAVATRALYARGRPLLAGAAVALGWVLSALIPLLVLAPDEGARPTLVVLGAASSVGMSIAAALLLMLLARAWGTEVVRALALPTLVALLALGLGAILASAIGDRWSTGIGPALGAGLLAGLGVAILPILLLAWRAPHMLGPLRRLLPGRRGER